MRFACSSLSRGEKFRLLGCKMKWMGKLNALFLHICVSKSQKLNHAKCCPAKIAKKKKCSRNIVPIRYLGRSIFTYPASRGYIFAVWDGERKVASADNRSIFYRACAKFVTRFASNWFVKSAWVSRESKLRKLLTNHLRTTLLELLFCFPALPVWF